MSKIYFDTGISLDGYMAGENRGPQNPLGDGGTEIHNWLYQQEAFWKNFGIDRGEANTQDNALVEKMMSRAGANIMGKRMFEEGEKNWPEDLFKTDVFVLTHEVRDPWIQKGSTTFYFINDGIKSALEKALKSAKGRDIRINGGADTIQQYLMAGLVDDFSVHIAPLVLGKGIRLFDHLVKTKVNVQIVEAVHSPMITHLKYTIKK